MHNIYNKVSYSIFMDSGPSSVDSLVRVEGERVVANDRWPSDPWPNGYRPAPGSVKVDSVFAKPDSNINNIFAP